ncbi:hypothetical protein GGI20_002407 [Coemansia sp. BCRC 34301]|nr:hypothetical protein GGI20_002407 [Coemansia sp. BCRC 34301]
MSTLHTQYSNSQTAAATAGSNSGPSGAGTGLDSSAHDSGAMANSPASRDAAAAAAVAAAAVASNGGVLSAADYSRGYSAMSPVSHGQMLPPPSQYLSQQQHHPHHQQSQQQHHHQQQQTQTQQHGHHQHQQQQQHGHHQQQQHHHQHHHSLPSIDMNGHAAAAAAVVGYPSSYGLADGTGAGAGGMVSLMSSPTATSWGHGPGSPLSPHNSVSAVAAAAAAAANQQHQSNGSWYTSMYQPTQYSPTNHGMVMYHDGYATSPTAAAAATAAYYPPRARLTTTLWEDEQTLVYQVDCRGICVARRHDDNMINGTKLLNVVGMSRGKRDGILKNEKGRRVVKVGPMHLKGVWIPFERARFLAEQFKVVEVLFPIFQPDPNAYLYGTIPMTSPTTAAGLPTSTDPYSAAAAAAVAVNPATGYTQLTRVQDTYDASMAAAAAAVSGNTPTTGSSSTGSHSHSASLSQAMAASSVAAAAQMHHHHHSSSSVSQGTGSGSGLGISYIATPTRLQGVPSSPQSLAALAGGSSTSLNSVATGGGGPVSPTGGSYMDSKNARYAPYGTATTGFQSSSSSGMTASGGQKQGLGSKRGSIDHHYHQLHASSAAAAAAVSSTSGLGKQQHHHHHQQQQHHHDPLMVGSSSSAAAGDQDNGLTMAAQGGSSSQQQQQQQHSSMTSSYFDGLLAKGDQ